MSQAELYALPMVRPTSDHGAATLAYVINVSLDGFVEDANGSLDWTAPSDEVVAFITDLIRPVGTYLYGRRMYETMSVSESDPTLAARSASMADFAGVWRAANKHVFSTTLPEVSTAHTRLERRFDPESIRALKASSARDLTIGGPSLAAQAFRAGLVDECRLFIHPVIVGDGKPAFPGDTRASLTLLGQHRFDCGVIYLKLRVEH